MPFIPIRLVNGTGIIQDIPGYELPPELWSNCLNVRAVDASIQSDFGFEPVLGYPLDKAYWIIPAFTASTDFWVYGGVGRLFAVAAGVHAEIGNSLGGSRDNRWNGGMFGGIGVFNNGVADPQEWSPPGLATATTDLSNWPANTTCRVIRPFGRYLVACDVTVSGSRNSREIRWSSSADIGAVPASWDYSDPSNDSGRWELSESYGSIIDCKPLGDVNFIYKQDEVHAMEYVGGRFIYRFRRRFPFGVLAQDCVVEHNRKHYVALHDDIRVHDGLQDESVLDLKMRKWLSGRPDPATSNRSFMVRCGSELLLCIPEAGYEEPNVALRVNLKNGACTIKELPGLAFIGMAPIDPNAGSTTFDAISIPFDQMVGQFGQRNFAPGRGRCVAVRPELDGESLLTLPASFGAGYVGAVPEELVLTANTQANGTANISEIRVEGTTFGHPDGTPRAITDSTEIATNFGEPIGQLGVFYLLWTDTAVGTRFTTLTFSGNQAQNMIAAVYETGVGWRAVDDDGTRETFTPVSTDVLFGAARADVAGEGIAELLPFFPQIVLMDQGFTNNGENFTAFVERTGLTVSGVDRNNNPIVDATAVKLVTQIWPKIRVQNGSTINIYCGASQTPEGNVMWQGPQAFNPSTDLYAEFDVEGPYLAVRFEKTDGTLFKLDEYGLEVTVIGRTAA